MEGCRGRNTEWKRGRDAKGGIESGREGDTERIQREEYKVEEREIQGGYKGGNRGWKRGRYREDTKGGIQSGREGDTGRIQRGE